jgi:hypothetical protein
MTTSFFFRGLYLLERACIFLLIHYICMDTMFVLHATVMCSEIKILNIGTNTSKSHSYRFREPKRWCTLAMHIAHAHCTCARLAGRGGGWNNEQKMCVALKGLKSGPLLRHIALLTAAQSSAFSLLNGISQPPLFSYFVRLNQMLVVIQLFVLIEALGDIYLSDFLTCFVHFPTQHYIERIRYKYRT